MATFHCQIKKGSKEKGKLYKSKLHCDYINREGRYANGKRIEELVYKEVGNLPPWASSGSEFFELADLYERNNSNVYMEFEVALPNELSLDENIKLVKKFVNENIGDNKVYSFAIHYKKATLDNEQEQPHAHIMFSERIILDKKKYKPAYLFFKRFNRKDNDKGGYEKDPRFTKSLKDGSEAVESVRASWAFLVNRAYAAKGLDLEVSHLSLKEQKIKLDEVILNQETEMTEKQWQQYLQVNREPQKHLGPKVAYQMLIQERNKIKHPNMMFNFMSPKAMEYLKNKEYKEKQLEEIKEMQRMAESNKRNGRFKNSFNDLKQQYEEWKGRFSSANVNLTKEVIVFSGDELIKKFDQSAEELSKAIRENNKKLMELDKDILTDERIEKVALSIYTKGKTKEINETLRRLERERVKFENEFNAFSEMPLPKMDNVQEKKDYYELKDRLDKWQDDLIKREKMARNDQEWVLKELDEPKHKANIQIIVNALTKKNTQTITKFNNLMSETKFLKSIGRDILQIKRAINSKVKYRMDKSIAKNIGEAIDSKDVSGLNHSINKIKNAIDSTQSVKPNNMKVNFHDRSKGRGDDMEL